MNWRLTCASLQSRDGVDLVDYGGAAGAKVKLGNGVVLSRHLGGNGGVKSWCVRRCIVCCIVWPGKGIRSEYYTIP